MGSEDALVEIHPRELRFLFEVNKRSSCCIHLENKSDEYVAFKVKTTSPKRYCVRPNIGVILPRASRDFIVTMQEQKTAPPDLQIKDKFLVQTTVVPFGTGDEGIVSACFSNDSDRYIEENKLRVILVSVTQPQVEQPIVGIPDAKATVEVPMPEEILDRVDVNELPNVVNEVCPPLKTSYPPLREIPATLCEISSHVKGSPTSLRDFLVVPSKEAAVTLSESASSLKETPSVSVESHFSSTETSAAFKEPPPLDITPAPRESVVLSDKESTNAENLPLSSSILVVPSKEAAVILSESAPSLKETPVSIESQFSSTVTSAAFKESPPLEDTPAPRESVVLSDKESTNAENLHLSYDLQSKINTLEVKLEKAKTLIVKLRAEARTTIQERDKLRKEMVFLKGGGAARSQASAGFPLLFVVYMALVGLSLGYLLHP